MNRRQFLLGTLGTYLRVALTVALVTCCSYSSAQNTPKLGGADYAPDAWLLESRGQSWWYHSKPSSTPTTLQARAATQNEQSVIDQARFLLSNRTAKAFALLDGDAVVFTDYKAPADSDSMFFSLSMGKTVTSLAVGQAICADKLKFETKAADLIPQLGGKSLGNATVRDLLTMSSGAAEPFDDSTIWTPEQFKRWGRGELTILESVTSDRVTQAARGLFGEYKPGEHFFYKSTDPMVLGLMITRATGMPYAHWVQETILDPMGAARTGLIVQDREGDGATDAGVRLRLDDWIRLAQWVKRSSKQSGCFGDYLRAAMTTQIRTSGAKQGKTWGGYGYLFWTDNAITSDTAWAAGGGGQRISWSRDNDRMIVLFSNIEDWMPEVYRLAKDWNHIRQ